MNKTKRVAWHKHLTKARTVKEKSVAATRARVAAARGASGVHAQPSGARTTTGPLRQTTPRP